MLITFEALHAEVRAHHAAEAARNAPAAVALDALNAVRTAWDRMTPAERSDIRRELRALNREIDDDAWVDFGAALAAREAQPCKEG